MAQRRSWSVTYTAVNVPLDQQTAARLEYHVTACVEPYAPGERQTTPAPSSGREPVGMWPVLMESQLHRVGCPVSMVAVCLSCGVRGAQALWGERSWRYEVTNRWSASLWCSGWRRQLGQAHLGHNIAIMIEREGRFGEGLLAQA
jgi:hypothetical protein